VRRAEIIAIGSELLLGGRLDTNSLFLTERLAALGIEVRFKSVVGDEEKDIASALRTAAGRVDIAVLTGGLGPTQDDCTRQAIARVTGRPLRRRADALEAMRRRLAAWRRVPSTAQLRQALIPSGADILRNPVGSAPGFALKWNGCLLAALPGVPVEAEQMFTVALAPRLAAERVASRTRNRIKRRVLQTFGLIESEVDRRLHGLIRPGTVLRIGLLASPLGVTISLTACGITQVEGVGRLDAVVRAVRKRLGKYVYAEGADTMEQVVGRHLAQAGLMLSVAESCTGGLIGHRLTQVPGSSEYFDQSVVCYSNQAKHDWLGVSDALLRKHGAVSAEVAAAMARGVRLRSHAAIGLSVTGIAGPGGGTDRKPVGLVYVGLDALPPRSSVRSREPRSQTREFRFHGDRHTIKLRASQAALDMLRQWLMARGKAPRP
jgi:nicotinamide-nucleotide amidase